MISIFAAFLLIVSSPSPQHEEITKIERVICSLKEEKNKLQKKVTFHENRGRDWQFNRENSLESKREYFLARQEYDKIKLLELKIANFEEKKNELLEDML